MFTGLVQNTGMVESCSLGDGAMQLVICVHDPKRQTQVGDSVCVSGVCLTACSVDQQNETVMRMDVSKETLRVSNLGELTKGDRVNLEWALRASDSMGGHIVSGHVDALGQINAIDHDAGQGLSMCVTLSDTMGFAIVPKGSISLDGVSLTINSVYDAPGTVELSVYLIPHTLTHTTLGERKIGDHLNIEIDMMARYLSRINHCRNVA